ncbi:hypothetical protein JTE90_005306 [Oedothorax gibbosus]|uniref:Uncharacterized protein n=1 Tax=Oedothorax gibbosus TaxID=931172 RepID=A0AAV6UI85_9ARAC|nr:hypothetical protein JTE90_005306 [Oedothorax gibbosus]
MEVLMQPSPGSTSPLSLPPPSPQPGSSRQVFDSPAGSIVQPNKKDLKKVHNRGLLIPAEKTQSLLDTQLEQIQHFPRLANQLEIMNNISKEQQKDANQLRAEKNTIFQQLQL